MAFLKEKFHDFVKNQGLKAGLLPVTNLEGEDDRLD